jgi:hypothetical protein
VGSDNRYLTKNKLSDAFLMMSLITYVTSLFFPVLNMVSEPLFNLSYEYKDSFLGRDALLYGAFGIFSGQVAWCANLFLWIAWFKYGGKNFNASMGFNLLAIAFALTFLANRTIPFNRYDVFNSQMGLGCYLWLLSIFMSFMASYLTINIEEDE